MGTVSEGFNAHTEGDAMSFSFLERLGVTLGQSVAERVLGRNQPAEATAPEAEAAPAADASAAEPPVTEAPAAEAPVAEAAPVEAAAPQPPAETWTPAPDPVPASTDISFSSPATDTATTTASEPAPADASAAAYVETTSVDAFGVTSTAPAAEPVADAAPVEAAPAVAEAPVVPEKSAEDLEEEQLWGELDGAWSGQDFERVTQILDRLRELQPENNAIIDEKISAAQYNQAAAFEQAGDLNRALYLYQEAQRRNPALGEATFAIERVQAALQPPPAESAPAEPAPPAEQSYTVESGDSLSAIAERFYGDANQWQRIFEANTDQLSDPNLIFPGQVLRVPA